MSEARRVLVIIDPTRDKHIALERAVITSEINDEESVVHLFLGVEGDSTSLKADNPDLYRDDRWLEDLLHPLRSAGVRFTMELCWSTEWQESVLNSALRFKPTHIFMPDYRDAKKGLFFSGQQWSLLRNTVAPVTIVRPDNSGVRKKILAAVNMQREDDDPRYAELIQKVLHGGMNIAKHYNAEFHVINAYQDNYKFPNRDRILKISGLPTQNVHVREGEPADVIAAFANEIGADTVIIGTMARQGTAAFLKGNTSEKLLSKLTQDVITFS
jgi:universal stress protein E